MTAAAEIKDRQKCLGQADDLNGLVKMEDFGMVKIGENCQLVNFVKKTGENPIL